MSNDVRTGPELFAEALRLRQEARARFEFPSDGYAQCIAEAQMCATLALAAATALGLDATPPRVRRLGRRLRGEDVMSDAPTPQEYEWAYRVVVNCTEDPDFMGVAEMLGDEWADLDEEAFDKRHRLVHDLACKATVTVSWPDEPAPEAPGLEQLKARLAAAELVCVAYGISPARHDSDREKATHELWSDWQELAQADMTSLSDERIVELARRRDANRAEALRRSAQLMRSEEPS